VLLNRNSKALPLKEISVKYLTTSVEKTVWLGQQLGDQLIDGDIIALIGDLGGGKTWFTKGVAIGLEIDPGYIVSPTFTLVNEYKGRRQLFHIDLYRLKDKAEIIALDLEDYLSGEGVVAIEWADRWPGELPEETIQWADRWPGELPEETIQIELRMIDDHTRELRFSGSHPRAKEIIRALKERVGVSLKEIK
jgi:tRNA threonylcarbamoyladenosine biosynthesis protein TsaE